MEPRSRSRETEREKKPQRHQASLFEATLLDTLIDKHIERIKVIERYKMRECKCETCKVIDCETPREWTERTEREIEETQIYIELEREI